MGRPTDSLEKMRISLMKPTSLELIQQIWEVFGLKSVELRRKRNKAAALFLTSMNLAYGR